MAGTEVGSFGSRPQGIAVRAYASNIGRGQTSAAVLFTLPANPTILKWSVSGLTNSNAGTNARISIGSSGGGGSDFLAAFDVKNGGASQSFPSSALTGEISDTNPIIVTATYAEAGTASTSGGPWRIECWVI